MLLSRLPGRDDEIITRITPNLVLLESLTGVAQPLVVGGHTHQQMIRNVHGALTFANAGSIGMPYEGRAGAFWMIIADGSPELRETSYDLDAALEELRAADFPDVEEQLDGSLLDSADPDWVAAFFEHGAGRGAHPGEPPSPVIPGHPRGTRGELGARVGEQGLQRPERVAIQTLPVRRRRSSRARPRT